jgi:RNA polymerase sigma-70 factor (ECF subfamily)
MSEAACCAKFAFSFHRGAPYSMNVSPSPEMEADTDLITRCVAGDLDAFDVLVERHQDRIFNLCYWTLGNREEAADAAQDAFVRAFRGLKNFRGDSIFSTWLHRIAVNVCIDAAQKRRRAPLLYSDIATCNEGETAPDIESRAAEDRSTPDTGEPGEAALKKEKRGAVRAALARLSDHYRVVLVLFDIEGHSYEEIAGALDLPLGTIKSRLNRARAQLREELQSARELFED